MDCKTCTKCNEPKPLTAFVNDRRRKDGKFPWCVSCTSTNRYSKQNPDAVLNGHLCPLCKTPVRGHANRRYCSDKCRNRVSALKKNFDLSPEDYRKLLDDTGGLCPICKSKVKKWCVDHNHETGEVTGIVCTRCNVGLLAYSNHDSIVAQRCANYLDSYPVKRVLGRAVVVPEGAKVNDSGLHAVWRRKDAA